MHFLDLVLFHTHTRPPAHLLLPSSKFSTSFSDFLHDSNNCLSESTTNRSPKYNLSTHVSLIFTPHYSALSDFPSTFIFLFSPITTTIHIRTDGLNSRLASLNLSVSFIIHHSLQVSSPSYYSLDLLHTHYTYEQIINDAHRQQQTKQSYDHFQKSIWDFCTQPNWTIRTFFVCLLIDNHVQHEVILGGLSLSVCHEIISR